MALDDALMDRDVPLRFLLQCADLARAAGQPQEGLAILKRFRDQYCDQPEYLVPLMQLGYAAGDEFAANEAFARLQQLQTEGRVPQEMLRAIPLDDLVEQVKRHREQSQRIHGEMLRGRASWLMAEEFLGRAPHLGWWIRTQPLDWLGDDPLHRAEHTIYSTNAFTIAEERRQTASLEPIECPAMGTTVVVDLPMLLR